MVKGYKKYIYQAKISQKSLGTSIPISDKIYFTKKIPRNKDS